MSSDEVSKADEARQKAATTRKRHSRTLMLNAAERLVEAGVDLGTMTMKQFAREAGVSTNTVTRQFPTVREVVAALVEQRDNANIDVPPRLRVQTDHQSLSHNREFVNEQLRTLRALSELNTDDAVEQMRETYAQTLDLHPEEHHLLAAQCCHLSYSLLLLPPSAQTASEAREVAENGLRHIGADKGRHYALSGQLARNAAAAAQRASQIACSAIEFDQEEREVLTTKIAVMKNLTAVAANKAIERRFQTKLNRPLTAAVAEFHRSRAIALIDENRDAEVESVLELARTLKEHAAVGGALPPRVLVPFLARMCAAQVAYERDPSVGYDRLKFRRLRDFLLATVTAFHTSDAETSGRALATMFALADRQRGHVDVGHAVHLPDLILLGGYGVIGQLLIAEFLYDLAKFKQSQADRKLVDSSEPSRPLYKIPESDLFAAAKMYYLEAPKNTIVVGSAAVLATRARDALRSDFDCGTSDSEDAKPWAVLKNGDLNAEIVNRLSLEVAIGKRPSVHEARAMLRELQPLLLTLRTIAGEEMKPDENGAVEMIATTGLRFY